MKNRIIRLLIISFILFSFTPGNIKLVRSQSNDRIPILGIDYLNGYGVDIKLHPTDNPPYDFESYGQGTYGGNYQCVELVVRFYAQVLGYDRWQQGDDNSKHRWPINPYSGQIMTPADMVGVVRYADTLNSSDPDYDDYRIFQDLEYYENGSITPPRPGDAIILNGGDHIGIISRVGGDKIELVEQNWSVAGKRTLNLSYYLGNFEIENTMGWIHSPRMDRLLTVNNRTTIPDQFDFGEFQWNRDRDTVYIYLSQKATENLGNDLYDPYHDTIHYLIYNLDSIGAISLTNSGYTSCILTQISNLIDQRFLLSQVKSLDFTLKYAGESIWVRAWWKSGPNSNSGWIKIDNIQCEWE